jgi:hypothetical protein
VGRRNRHLARRKLTACSLQSQHEGIDRPQQQGGPFIMENRYNAVWWTKDHDSSWDKVKEAFRRDWDQTKHDFGASLPDLKQDVPDTVKQAAGKQAIPPPGTPNFEEHEPALRFGYGARLQYGKEFPKWDDRLERKLQKDWSPSGDEASWHRYSKSIRRGYEFKTKS